MLRSVQVPGVGGLCGGQHRHPPLLLSSLPPTPSSPILEKCNLTDTCESDTTGIPVLMITSEAYSNVTLPCPGVTERSLITTLQWASHTKLVEYMSETTTVWEHRHRINLLSDNFALHFHPVTAEDSGEYSCLVNNRPKPEAIVKLVVQGKR
ncbi:hypothetical protein RUM43_011747 [Polyplax serrata]|uniref:Ig-like domain-containing protein n=1 Tax=Polyplax serrata TaxID=468196 RepID=A0AAN8S461_POLSC